MAQEEEVLGKAYDSRLMKRLVGYLRPYWWQTIVALSAILLKVVLGPDVIGPFLTATVIDKYLAFGESRHWFIDRWLS
ncbi:MAG TPA: ABC transporter ATP-binding protein, partial [Candidatus Angelobacter sp.]|nr:ABC transporter ATP-binding protein [Candidatus Angelobacter sp.]